MGASDSKLVFKKGIFRLSEERHIAADDPYWTSVRPELAIAPVSPGRGVKVANEVAPVVLGAP